MVIGSARQLQAKAIEVERVSWVRGAPPQDDGAGLLVQIRAHGDPAGATVETAGPRGDRMMVSFDRPERGAAPGQAAVIYRGDEVLGGGTIARLVR